MDGERIDQKMASWGTVGYLSSRREIILLEETFMCDVNGRTPGPTLWSYLGRDNLKIAPNEHCGHTDDVTNPSERSDHWTRLDFHLWPIFGSSLAIEKQPGKGWSVITNRQCDRIHEDRWKRIFFQKTWLMESDKPCQNPVLNTETEFARGEGSSIWHGHVGQKLTAIYSSNTHDQVRDL